jgi:hypothetical protein
MTDTLHKAKLAKLIEIEGYDSTKQLMDVFSDAVSPAICMNAGCDFTCEMEPDQDAGYWEVPEQAPERSRWQHNTTRSSRRSAIASSLLSPSHFHFSTGEYHLQ